MFLDLLCFFSSSLLELCSSKVMKFELKLQLRLFKWVFGHFFFTSLLSFWFWGEWTMNMACSFQETILFFFYWRTCKPPRNQEEIVAKLFSGRYDNIKQQLNGFQICFSFLVSVYWIICWLCLASFVSLLLVVPFFFIVNSNWLFENSSRFFFYICKNFYCCSCATNSHRPSLNNE